MDANGKAMGSRLTDFRISPLSMNEVSTCRIDAEMKFQKIKPLNAYKG